MEEEAVKKEYDLLKKSPYSYICDWIDSIYPHTGKKVFSVLALVPGSLILPDLPFMGKTVRSNINCMFLAPSSAGKSSLSKQFSFFAYNPIEVESITPAKLERKINALKNFTLIVGDFARMAKDLELIKIVENILGDEKKLSRETMIKEIDAEVNGVGLLCGTPQDLSNYLSGGLIFRLVPIIIFHDVEEHSMIGKHIMKNIGNEKPKDSISKEGVISALYQELSAIQSGEHPDIKPILGYSIDESFKDKAYAEWDKMTRPIVGENSLNFFRELQEFFRFLISHAFLNVFNRKIIDNKLVIEEEDFKIALRLMKRNISVKYKILRTERFAKGLRTLQDLNEVLQNQNIPEEDKMILKNLARIKRPI